MSISWRLVAYVGCAIGFAAFLSVYVVHMSLATQRGFALRDVERSVDDLRTRREFLGAKLAERERLTRLQARVESLGFVRPQTMTFLDQPSTVAVR
jgi:hypothetical protein